MYTKKEVLKSTLNYFNRDDLATDVWINKYALKDADDNPMELTPEDMHTRLANELYRIELQYKNPTQYETIKRLLTNFNYFILAGSCMFGIGNNNSFSSLGNCFVIGNDHDSYSGILRLDEEQVNLMKRRAGVGFDISHLRAKGSKVTNSAKTSTGAVSFMHRFSHSTNEVAQEGRRKLKSAPLYGNVH